MSMFNRYRFALTGAALAALLMACTGASDNDNSGEATTSGDTPTSSASGESATSLPASGEGSTTSPAATDPTSVGDLDPARACSAILNARPAEVVEPGRDAMLEVLRFRTDVPDAGETREIVEALEQLRAQYVAERDTLANVQAPDDDAESWADVIGAFDDEISVIDSRVAALQADDVTAAVSALPVGRDHSDAFATAIESLGLNGRDCEAIVSFPGVPAEQADFHVAAAQACTAIVERRAGLDMLADTRTVIDLLAAVLRDQPLGDLTGVREAAERLRDEWAATRDDLAAVASDDAPDPAGWEQVVRYAAETSDRFRIRADAVAGGDETSIREQFAPGEGLAEVGFEGFGPNGLDRRDCRSIQA